MSKIRLADFLLIVVLVIAAFVLSSCGGGGGGGGNGANGLKPVSVLASIDWPQRSRDVSGPTSALSVSFLIHDSTGHQGDVTWSANRSASLLSHVESYRSAAAVVQSRALVFSGTFYAAADENGIVVATFSVPVAVQQNGAMTKPDGSALGTIQFDGVAKSVAIANGQSVVIGVPTQLVITAYDGGGNPMAITPGSFFFAVISGGSNLSVTPDGIATGIAAGPAVVQGSVDGLLSPQASITINRPLISGATFQIVWPERSRSLSHNLSSALSVSVDFKQASGNGSDVVMPIDRDPTQVSGYTGTYTIPEAIDPNVLSSLTATFYAQAGETGAVVGTATASATASGTNVQIASIVLSGVIKHVAVVPATLTVGSGATQLQFSCTDVANNVVAVTPGSALWSIASGGSFLSLTLDGIATPVAAGTAEVVATVDGVASPQGAVTVNPVAPAADFLNPGFELPAVAVGSFVEQEVAVPNWTPPTLQAGWTDTGFGVANGSGSWGTGAKAGAQYAFLQTANADVDTDQGSCTQTINGLVVGGTYKVTFWMAARNGDVGGNVPTPVFLTANASTIFPATTPASTTWTAYTSNVFTATTSSYTFTFSTQPAPLFTNSSSLLDEVHLVRVS